MAKSHLRWSAASGSAKVKVLKILARGWEPGVSIGTGRDRKENKKAASDGGPERTFEHQNYNII